jgi:DNA-binding winged helix-turn-helix (wHTH) protein/Tol biopolymer transport system component
VTSPALGSRDGSRRQYHFGEFTLDLDRGILTRSGEEVALRPKSFEALTYLVERHGQLVTKSSLVEAVWPDTVVSDNSLAQCVFDIRRALGDDSQQLIHTKARRGYVFTPRVTRPTVDRPGESALLPLQEQLHNQRKLTTIAIFAMVAISIVVIFVLSVRRAANPMLVYEQITNFTDSAVSPSLSPDGRMLAFIRGEFTFGGPGQIYIKPLPDGEPVQLTRDLLDKRGNPQFSPDGTRIAYAAHTPESGWHTWVVPVLGGQPRLFLTNASGLTWMGRRSGDSRLLFSELTGVGDQMAIVSSTESRSQHRTVYLPPEMGMAHRSYLSPDGKQVLLAEMDHGLWLPCRLIPLGSGSPGRQVGPVPAHCTDAAWAPDGKSMYFSVDAGNGFHIWHQRFPDGVPEPITSGATQEEGIAIAPDGRSFFTSIGTSHSTIWFHDSRGERQITSEGYGFLPSVSPDGKKLYYLLRGEEGRHFLSGELWVADLELGQRQRLLPDLIMQHYAISADGQRVVFVMPDGAGRAQVWIAALNGGSAPRQIANIDVRKVYFGGDGHVLFLGEEKGTKFVYRVKEDGSELKKIVSINAPSLLLSASPDGTWIVIPGSTNDMVWPAMVYPINGGSPKLLCLPCASGNDVERTGPPGVSWSPDGKFLYLNFQDSIYAIPLRPGQMLPTIPSSGFRSKQAVAALPNVQLISKPGAFPGPAPSIYAFTKLTTQRNIYRVSLR